MSIYARSIMEIDNEHLIAEVHKFPCLYQVEHQEYRNKELKNKNWLTVAKRVLEKGRTEEFSEAEVKLMSKEVQKRWKNLRDAYMRALRCQLERGATKPYVYEKLMSFLLPAPSSQNIPVPVKEEPDENLVICEPDVNTSDLEDTQNDSASALHHSTRYDYEMAHTLPYKKRKSKDHDQDYNLYLVDTNSCEHTDDDTMFLMSLAPSFRQIPPSAKLDARIKILEALKPFIPYHK